MLRKIVVGSLMVASIVQLSFAHNIKNAKIGSTIIIDWNTNFTIGTDGHAAVVISEYKDDNDGSFIVGAHGDGVKYDSYSSHIGSYNHLGHFRAISRNYSFSERTDIANAAIKLIGKDYEFLNLYIYNNSFNRNDNIPISRNTVPSDVRCDGVAEWSTEVSVNSGTPKKSDGFYISNNPFTNKPIHIRNKQVDKIGTPAKPTLSSTNNSVSIQFPKVDGAWSQALYAVYRSEDSASYSKVHCSSGHNISYIDKDVEVSNIYHYKLIVGERTASCDNLSEYYSGETNDWSKLSEASRITIKDEETNVDLGSSIVDGAGSIINPNNKCWGCNKDEADMQVHSSNPSTVVFQWQRTDSCPYLDIGILNEHTNAVSNHQSLDVIIHRKSWNDISATAYKTTLPVTIKKKDVWNTIAVTSQQPISSKKKIVAYCSKSIVHSPSKQTISSNKVNLEYGYVWAGNSSIIRRDNPDSTQGDGIYKDVAISLFDNKAITLFQWQPSSTCTSLKLKSGFYPNGNGASANVKFVDMKGWSDKNWNYRKQCNGKLPCTLTSPSGASGYYVIRVKTDANALDGNYISAVCQ